MGNGEMRQDSKSPGDEALKHFEKIIGPLSPKVGQEYSKRVDEFFDREALSEIIKTKIVDLFETKGLKDRRTEHRYANASVLLRHYFDPKNHPNFKRWSFDPNVTVGDIIKFRLVKGKFGRLYSQHKETGSIQMIEGLGDVLLETIQERLGTLGLKLEIEKEKRFSQDS